MKQFAFPLSIKCASVEERDECLNLLESIGYKTEDIDDLLGVTNVYGEIGICTTIVDSAIYLDGNYYIDHFNPALIRDIASVCTNDTWQKGELWVGARGELGRIAGCIGFDVNPNGHRRPTLSEICEHHGYEIKGRDILKKEEKVSESDHEIRGIEFAIRLLQMYSYKPDKRYEEINRLKAENAELKEKLEEVTDVDNQELERLRGENAELKENIRKRPTIFEHETNGGYFITFENTEAQCIEFASCGKARFNKVLKALHD